MKIVLSHPTANNFTRALVSTLVERGELGAFYTSLAVFEESWLQAGISKFSANLGRRSFKPMLKPFTHIYPWYEAGRLLARALKLNQLLEHETGFFCVDEVYRRLDMHVATQLTHRPQHEKVVYAYEDGALYTFKQAKKLGLTCVYDLPIAYWETGQRLMADEAQRLPAWAGTLGGGIKDSSEKLEKKHKELQLADAVVVPSQFVVDSLPDWALQKKIIVSPFGTPTIHKGVETNWRKVDKGPLRLLFAGSMGQRKGLADLFAAMRYFQPHEIELVVMGSLQAPMDFYRKEFSDFTYEPGRPNEQVLALMRTCDVFCLPSIVEGRALVMQEAMSQGLPLIITANTGGADLIEEGETGFVVPMRSPEKIAEKLNWFLENRTALFHMKEAAQKKAATYTWKKYGYTIAEAIKELLKITSLNN
ncbi:glycosyltransferase [Runella sp. MFBS21]|uniref:glycosyltransferase family 4 protein n=1 Tax=Runella sp. MFBS21 TaxID=3034018 RepID=UPI0023F90196|nr:glycosyltransferase [Runella sp. MFBS21]MDF7820402.1 glycosyltransferase [Runella sp. MFBS21]